MSGGVCVLRAGGHYSNTIWTTGCVWLSLPLSATLFTFLKILEPSGMLFTHHHIFYLIHLCGGYREAEAYIPFFFHLL